MKALVKLAVFLAVLFVVFEMAKPHLDRLTGTLGLGDLGGGGTPDGRCIAVARRTTDTFTDLVRERGRPPVDLNRWAGSYRLAEGRLRDAELECQCDGGKCELGQEALGLLAQHMRRWDDAVQGQQPYLNGARTLGRIYDLLDTAERADS